MHYSQEEKTKLLEEWKQSGQSAYKYAKSNGLTPQTFTNWIKDEAGAKLGFVEIPAKTMAKIESGREIIIEKGDIKIRVPMTGCIKELETVFRALGAVK